MNPVIDRPNCPQCKKPMRLIATGKTSRTFYCTSCILKKTVDREFQEKLARAIIVCFEG